jgi:hypothetical protein
MAENIVVTAGGMNQSVEPLRSGRGSELVVLTGTASAAGDTSAAYTFRTIKRPSFVEGGAYLLENISGNAASFKSLIALGSNAVTVRVYEALP